MPTQRYSVTQPPIETLFTWIKSGEIAIPEIQRPFVWDATKVRNLLLTGQSTLFPGLLAAAIAGLRTAGNVLGMKPTLEKLQGMLDDAETFCPEGRALNGSEGIRL